MVIVILNFCTENNSILIEEHTDKYSQKAIITQRIHFMALMGPTEMQPPNTDIAKGNLLSMK